MSALKGASPYRIALNGPGMRRAGGANRRFGLLLLLVACLLSILFLVNIRSPDHTSVRAQFKGSPDHGSAGPKGPVDLTGHVISSKLGNETLKAELGRAAWKVLHTTFARFPDEPTAEEQEALRTYVHLFQRLYPCGECGEHFGKILKKYPPQVASRSAAAAWGCHVHNLVNQRLHKEEFDCSKIGDFYDCGCADDDQKEAKGKKKDDTAARETQKRSARAEPDGDGAHIDKVARKPPEIEVVGITPRG